MCTASKTTSNDIYHLRLGSIDPDRNFTNGVHTTQHCPTNNVAKDPPCMFSDDASSVGWPHALLMHRLTVKKEAGLESNELYMTSNEPSTPYPSLAHTETCSRYFPAEEHEGDLLPSLELSVIILITHLTSLLMMRGLASSFGSPVC